MSDIQERWAAMKGVLKPVSSAPTMRRTNGCGVILLGRQREIPGSRMFIKGLWATFAFIPIWPFRFYVVSGSYDEYYFHASLSTLDFIKLYRWKFLNYYLSVWIESAIRAAIIIGIMLAVGGVIHYIFDAFR